MKAPAALTVILRSSDAGVMAMIRTARPKAHAPEPLVPTNRFRSPEGHSNTSWKAAGRLKILKKTPDLRAHAVDSPLDKTDAYEWYCSSRPHSERHTKQIEEVKADPTSRKITSVYQWSFRTQRGFSFF